MQNQVHRRTDGKRRHLGRIIVGQRDVAGDGVALAILERDHTLVLLNATTTPRRTPHVGTKRHCNLNLS